MPNQTITVEQGEIYEISLSVTPGEQAYQVGSTVAQIIDLDLNIQIGTVTDGNSFTLPQGNYLIECIDRCGHSVEILQRVTNTTEFALSDCGSDADISGTAVDVMDIILPLRAPFSDTYADGTTQNFNGFPWAVSGTAAQNSGMFFTARPNPPAVDPDCQSFVATSLVFRIDYTQLTDQDAVPNDLGDIIFIVGQGTDSVSITASTSDPETTVNNIGNFALAITQLADPAFVDISIDNPENYTLTELYSLDIGVAVERQGDFILQGITRTIEYTISDTCVQPMHFTKDCNSDAALAELVQVNTNVESIRGWQGHVCYELNGVSGLADKIHNSVTGTLQYFDTITNAPVDSSLIIPCQDSDGVLSNILTRLDQLIVATQDNQPIDYTSQLQDIITAVQSIDADTTSIESVLGDIDLDVSTIATNTQNIINELQLAITQLQALDANTDGVEQGLADILAAINTSDTETYGNQILAAGDSFTFPSGTYSLRVTPEPGASFNLVGLDQPINNWEGILGWGTGDRPSDNSDSVTVTSVSGVVLLQWNI